MEFTEFGWLCMALRWYDGFWPEIDLDSLFLTIPATAAGALAQGQQHNLVPGQSSDFSHVLELGLYDSKFRTRRTPRVVDTRLSG